MRQQYSPNIYDIMLPHNKHFARSNYNNIENNYENYSGSGMRTHIETSVLSDLVRKVDWLSDEVSNLKQALSVYENRVSTTRTTNGYFAAPSARHEAAWRGNAAIRNERTSSVEVSSAYRPPNPPAFAESQRESQREASYAMARDERPTSTSVENNTPVVYRKYCGTSYPYENPRHPPAYDPEKNPHSTRALAFDAGKIYDSRYNPSDSPGSSSSVKSERLQQSSHNMEGNPSNVNPMEAHDFNLSENLTLSEIIQLWQHGLDDIPPILSWSIEQKIRHRDQLEVYFRVYHLFRISCHGNINRFIAEYSDATGMQAGRVASLCPDISDAFTAFIKAQPEISAERIHKDVYTLPRKINGRKVSAKDVIQLWEHGMGDIPPIKTWNKSQKFKQQSKISRWKKIVDIFKYQCNSDMKTFTTIYSDGHGCLLPVAAITSKFETVYGDELSITSKLMTVSTAVDAPDIKPTPTVTPPSIDDVESKKRKADDEPFDEDKATSEQFSNPGGEKKFKSPPALIRSSPPPNKLMKDDTTITTTGEPTTCVPSLTAAPTTTTLSGGTIGDVTTTAGNASLALIECKREQSEDTSSSYQTTYREDDEENRNKEAASPHIAYPGNGTWSAVNTTDGDKKEVTINLNEIPEVRQPTPTPTAGHIPENVNVKDAIVLWEKGSAELSPIKKWTPQQKENQRDLISRIEKIYYIYSDIFKRNYNYFLRECSTENGQLLLSMDDILQKFNSFIIERGPFLAHPIGVSTSSMTFDFSHHKTLIQCTDELYLLPRKINGRKVNAKDVLQLWYHGVNKIPPVKHWSPQQKAVQQSKISRWKKIVDLYEQDFRGNWEHFENHFSNTSGQLLPISAIIAKHEEEHREMGSTEAHLYH